jgi:hypothetical protein
MTEIKDRRVDWERVADVRRMVGKLPTEDRKQAARFTERYWALHHARKELSGEQPIASERFREHVVEVLEAMRREIDASFRAWREERGIPEL